MPEPIVIVLVLITVSNVISIIAGLINLRTLYKIRKSIRQSTTDINRLLDA